MNELIINTKYRIGDKVYIIEKADQIHECHICEGKGKIDYKDKEMKCPECMGKGFFVNTKSINAISENEWVVKEIKIKIESDGSILLRYKITDGTRSLNRAEENVFMTKDDAINRCIELNTNTMNIDVENIEIQDAFKDHSPSPIKVMSKIDYYHKNGKFAKPIRVDKNNVLQDGYIDYLICKTFNIKNTKVAIV